LNGGRCFWSFLISVDKVRAVEIFDSPLIEINDGMCPI
jgi:hypothetical protein